RGGRAEVDLRGGKGERVGGLGPGPAGGGVDRELGQQRAGGHSLLLAGPHPVELGQQRLEIVPRLLPGLGKGDRSGGENGGEEEARHPPPPRPPGAPPGGTRPPSPPPNTPPTT